MGLVEGFLHLTTSEHTIAKIRILYCLMGLDPISTLSLECHGAMKEVEFG